MTSELRELSVAPVQVWGTTELENERRRAAESRPKRSCVRCSTTLSAYNSDVLCGPCRYAATSLEASMENHPAKGQTEVTCKWCTKPFTREATSRRRLCLTCWKGQE